MYTRASTWPPPAGPPYADRVQCPGTNLRSDRFASQSGSVLCRRHPLGLRASAGTSKALTRPATKPTRTHMYKIKEGGGLQWERIWQNDQRKGLETPSLALTLPSLLALMLPSLPLPASLSRSPPFLTLPPSDASLSPQPSHPLKLPSILALTRSHAPLHPSSSLFPTLPSLPGPLTLSRSHLSPSHSLTLPSLPFPPSLSSSITHSRYSSL